MKVMLETMFLQKVIDILLWKKIRKEKIKKKRKKKVNAASIYRASHKPGSMQSGLTINIDIDMFYITALEIERKRARTEN